MKHFRRPATERAVMGLRTALTSLAGDTRLIFLNQKQRPAILTVLLRKVGSLRVDLVVFEIGFSLGRRFLMVYSSQSIRFPVFLLTHTDIQTKTFKPNPTSYPLHV